MAASQKGATIGLADGDSLRPNTLGTRRSMPRERLLSLARRDGPARLILVVAPAGSGKSTLLAQLAAEHERVAWVTLDRADAPVERLLHKLEDAVVAVDPDAGGGWRSVEQAVACLVRIAGRPLCIAIDDLHEVQETRAETYLARLIARAPPTVSFLAASRARPALGIARRRVAGDIVELGGDALRFRSWEVDRLFREFYGKPLAPGELAELARRTEGWVAGLQLFHLATREKSPSERRRLLGSLGARWNLVREYLAQNALDGLPDELREFLIETSILTHLSGELCDALLGRRDSVTLLAELERRQVFTFALGDGSYRYHEVLRRHLETTYVDRASAERARAQYVHAATLLEDTGLLPDALRAYCRAEAWDDVARVLGQNGEVLVNGGGAWIDQLPPSLLAGDPWLALAVARRYFAEGRLQSSVTAYRTAARLFGDGFGATTCRRELMAVDCWSSNAPPRPNEPYDLIRAATIRDPMLARRKAATLDGPGARLAGGVAALLAGQVRDASALLGAAMQDPEATPELAATALLASAVALLLADDPRGQAEAERAADEADRLGVPWLARTARAALALTGAVEGPLEARAARVMSEQAGDAWGVHVQQLLEGLGALRSGSASADVLEHAVAGFRELGAGLLESWARGAFALALVREALQDPEPRAAALQAEVAARRTGSKAGQALSYLALAHVADDGSEYVALAEAIADETGLALPRLAARIAPPPSLELRLFGGLELRAHGRKVDVRVAKPRARRALRYLALHAGRPVHREALMEALWPGSDVATATRNLHVLVSSLRQVLEPGVKRGKSKLIVREDEAYQLTLPDDARVDLIEFDTHIATGRRAQARGRLGDAADAYEHALALYTGELLPEDGPADWIVDERDARRAAAAEAALGVGSSLLARGMPLAAAAACERGLAIDRQQDDLWRMCADAYTQASDPAAAARTRAGYERMLRQLGISPPSL